MAEALKVEEQPVDIANAQLEGDDAEGEDVFGRRVKVRQPIPLDVVFHRLEKELRKRGSTLLATYQPRESAIAEVAFWVWEAEMRDGGTVRAIDLVKRAYEIGGVIAKCESPTTTWASGLLLTDSASIMSERDPTNGKFLERPAKVATWASAHSRLPDAKATARRLKRFRRVKDALIADRGGDPTQAQTILAENAARLAIWLEEQMPALMKGDDEKITELGTTMNTSPGARNLGDRQRAERRDYAR